MTNVRWALAPFLALTLGMIVACGGDSDDGGDNTGVTTTQSQTTSSQTTAGITTSATQSAPTGAQSPSGTSGSLDVGSLAENLEDVESFRFNLSLKMDFDMPQGGTGSQEDAAAAAMLMALLGNIQAEGAFVAPDRTHVEMTIFGMNVETIQIGSESWINDGSGWVVDDGTGSFSTPFDMSSPASFPFELIPEEELEGAETSREEVNGFDTTRYHFDKEALAAMAEAEGDTLGMADLSEMDTLDMDVWITDEGIPVKVFLEAEGESEGSQIAIALELNLTDLNDDSIEIEPPL